jgi:hypothetical protein
MACISTTKARCGSGPIHAANGENTIDVLRRLRAGIPKGKLIVIWDGAPYHRAKTVWAAAASLDIHLEPLPGARWVAGFNRDGLAAVVPRHGGGHPVRYGEASSGASWPRWPGRRSGCGTARRPGR